MEWKTRFFLGISIGVVWTIAGLMIYGGPPAKIVTLAALPKQTAEKSVETAKADAVRAELEYLRAEETARQKEQWKNWQADRARQAANRQKQIREEEKRELARRQHEWELENIARAEAKRQADEAMQAAIEQEQIKRRLSEVNGGPPIKKPRAKKPVEVAQLRDNDGMRQYLKEQHRRELREKYVRRARKSLAARYAMLAANEANARYVEAEILHDVRQARALLWGW